MKDLNDKAANDQLTSSEWNGARTKINLSAGDSNYQYSLITAWDLSIATYDKVSKSVLTETSFKPDGTTIYLIASTNDIVHQYESK